MYDPFTKNYPNIAQSFGILGILILSSLLLSPVTFLKAMIGDEAALLLYYLMAIGIPFWIIYSIRKRRSGIHSFNFSIRNKRPVPWIIIGAVTLLTGVIMPIMSSIPMPEAIENAFREANINMTGIFGFITLVLAAPILEELIFRGVMLDGLLKRYSPAKSILVSAIFFGLFHLNPWQFVAGFFAGILAGWVYYKTRSVTYPIIVHASINLTAFIMNSLEIDYGSFEMFGGVKNLILLIACSLLILYLSIYFLRKEFANTKTTVNIKI